MTEISLIGSVLGMILGSAGFTISLMNYVRDRPRIRLTLTWDMTETVSMRQFGLVKVTNVGRRPVFISIVAIQLPQGFKHSHLILNTSVPGTKLSEGDAPIAHTINYDGLEQYSKKWHQVRAYAEDSTGKRYVSAFPRKSAKKPSWFGDTV